MSDSRQDALIRQLQGALGGSPVPSARVYNNAAITLTTATETTLTFNTERWDTASLHDTGSNTGRLTVPTGADGIYSITAHVRFASNATGVRFVGIRLNGSTFIAADLRQAVNGDATVLSVPAKWQMVGGDYVEVRAYQNSGGNLDVTSTGNYSPEFEMARLPG